MLPNIYTVEDFEERLSELAIGTDEVKHLMNYVHSLNRMNRNQARRLETAAILIGHQTIEECMMGEDYE